MTDTKVIAEGNLIYKSNISGKDEVGQLADEFNRMADSLRKLIVQVLQTVDTTSSSSKTLTEFIKEVREISREVETISERIKQGSQDQSELMHDGALKQNRYLDKLTGNIQEAHAVVKKFNV